MNVWPLGMSSASELIPAVSVGLNESENKHLHAIYDHHPAWISSQY